MNQVRQPGGLIPGGIAFVWIGLLAALIGLAETWWANPHLRPDIGTLLYGLNLHLLVAFASAVLARFILWRGDPRRIITVALGIFLGLELGLVGAYWLSYLPIMPPLSSRAGQIAFLGIGASGIVVAVLVAVLVRRIMPPLRGVRTGRGGLILAAALLVANAIVLPRWLASSPMIPVRPDAKALNREPVLFILVDTLREDHLSSSGYERATTPRIDELMAESWVFTQAYAQSSWTIPSVASIFTGMHPSSHRIRLATDIIPDECPTLAEHFRTYGYRTGAFVANMLVTTSNGYGQGFEVYWPPGPPAWSYRQRTALEQIVTRLSHAGGKGQGWRINQAFLQWVGRVKDEPWFAYIHYLEPHAPYTPPARDRQAVAPGVPAGPMFHPKWVDLESEADASGCYDWECLENPPALTDIAREGMIANYDGDVHLVDRRIGDLLDALESAGLLEQLHIIFCADHGEQFFEHAGWGHSHSIYEELTRIPLAYRPPGGIPGGRQITRPVALLDLVATLAPVLGFDPPPLHQGLAIPELLGEAPAPRAEPVLSELPPRMLSIRLRNWKLIRRGTNEGPDWRLFDVTTDPGEQLNLAAALPDTLAFLRGYAEGLVAKYEGLAVQNVDHAVDPELLRQLRGLGYIQ